PLVGAGPDLARSIAHQRADIRSQAARRSDFRPGAAAIGAARDHAVAGGPQLAAELRDRMDRRVVAHDGHALPAPPLGIEAQQAALAAGGPDGSIVALEQPPDANIAVARAARRDSLLGAVVRP